MGRCDCCFCQPKRDPFVNRKGDHPLRRRRRAVGNVGNGTAARYSSPAMIRTSHGAVTVTREATSNPSHRLYFRACPSITRNRSGCVGACSDTSGKSVVSTELKNEKIRRYTALAAEYAPTATSPTIVVRSQTGSWSMILMAGTLRNAQTRFCVSIPVRSTPLNSPTGSAVNLCQVDYERPSDAITAASSIRG